VIGAGVVGLATARYLALCGKQVVVLEKEDALVAGVSSGNSGIGCTGYDAPEGSLERRLLARSIQLHPSIMRSFGLGYEHVRKCGSLLVAWNSTELDALDAVEDELRAAGDVKDVQRLSRDELREAEPCLSEAAVGGVLVENEAVVEPWLVSIGYAQSAKRAGATILTGQQVVKAVRHGGLRGFVDRGPASPEKEEHDTQQKQKQKEEEEEEEERDEEGVWTLTTKEGRQFRCDVVVNCGGLFADTVERLRDPKHNDFEIKPRRGQFVVLQPGPSLQLSLNHIVAPVPNRVTKGIQMFQSPWGNIIVGPTAVDQQSRVDRTCHDDTRTALLDFAQARLGTGLMRDTVVAGEYVGIRPATEHQDYQIKKHPGQNWITVGGIRSSGLSGASGIAEHVGSVLLGGHAQPPQLGISDAVVNQVPAATNASMSARVPSFHALAAQFRERGDGTLEIDGHRWRVTHPITVIGLQSIDILP
jgi:glycerol-3-phosphate dehydrogenase